MGSLVVEAEDKRGCCETPRCRRRTNAVAVGPLVVDGGAAPKRGCCGTPRCRRRTNAVAPRPLVVDDGAAAHKRGCSEAPRCRRSSYCDPGRRRRSSCAQTRWLRRPAVDHTATGTSTAGARVCDLKRLGWTSASLSTAQPLGRRPRGLVFVTSKGLDGHRPRCRPRGLVFVTSKGSDGHRPRCRPHSH